jgi:hypothetical protein
MPTRTTASQMVNSNLTSEEAYEAVPELHARGRTVLQNLRKRARLQRGLNEAADPAQPAAKPAAKPPKPKANPKPLLPKGKRLRSDQVDAVAAENVARRNVRSQAHKEATSELAQAREGGRTSNGKLKEIVDRVNEQHNLSPSSMLTTGAISKFVKEGRSGASPEQPGPKPKTPKEFTKALGLRAQLLQISGQEVGSRKLITAAMASLQDSEFEDLLDTKSKRRQLMRAVKAACPELRTRRKQSADDRRAEWLCRSRLIRWFMGYVQQLKDAGFIEPKPDDPLFIPIWKLRRMLNSDEKHHKLSNEGAASGSRANVIINPNLARCGNRVISSSRHITSVGAWGAFFCVIWNRPPGFCRFTEGAWGAIFALYGFSRLCGAARKVTSATLFVSVKFFNADSHSTFEL